jgi:TolA-binding protein
MTALAAQMNNVPLLVRNVKILVSTYATKKSKWVRKQKKADRKKAATSVETLLFEYATAIDRQGRDQNRPADMKSADSLYSLYQKTFPKGKQVYDVQFFQAQLQFATQQHTQAAESLLAMIKGNPKGKYTKDSLEILVTAAQTAVDADKKKYKLPKPGKAKKEMKIPKVKQLYADSLEMFLKYLPNNPNAAAMHYALGSTYYDFGHYKVGAKRYFTLMKRFPTNEFAVPAAARVFEYYKHQKSDKAYVKLQGKIGAIPQLKAKPELAQ